MAKPYTALLGSNFVESPVTAISAGFIEITVNPNYSHNFAGVEYYSDADSSYNTAFPGYHSYILNNNVRIANSVGGTNIKNVSEKIIMFDYSLQRSLASSDNFSFVRFGTGSSTPLIGMSEQEGLYVNIGRGDGSQQSRTYSADLQVDGGHWHDAVDEVQVAQAEVIIPQSKSGSITIQVDIQLDDNGNDEGTHSETVTITDVGLDQDLGNRTFNYTIGGNRIIHFVYEAVNNDLSFARRVLFLRPTQAFTNAALTYNVRAFERITETWNHPTTYARFPINSGDPHDRFGLFDPDLWNTERLRTPEHVAFMLRTYRQGDSSADPEMALYAVVDGEHEGPTDEGRLIRLHRPKSDFDTSICNIGNNNSGVAHIQMYTYDKDKMPTEAEFYSLVTAREAWLNAFTDSTETTDRFILNGDLEIDQKLLIKSSGTQILKEITVDDANIISVKSTS